MHIEESDVNLPTTMHICTRKTFCLRVHVSYILLHVYFRTLHPTVCGGAETHKKNLLCKRPGNLFMCQNCPTVAHSPTSFISETPKFSPQRHSVEFRVQTAIASDVGIFIGTRFVHVYHFRFLVRRFVYCLLRGFRYGYTSFLPEV